MLTFLFNAVKFNIYWTIFAVIITKIVAYIGEVTGCASSPYLAIVGLTLAFPVSGYLAYTRVQYEHKKKIL